MMELADDPRGADHEVRLLSPADVQPDPKNSNGRTKGPAFLELKDDIKRHGMLQPIVVTPSTGDEAVVSPDVVRPYQLIAGHRRLQAAIDLGLELVAAVIVSGHGIDRTELQVVENLHRLELSPLDEALLYAQMGGHPTSPSPEAIGAKIGRSARYVYDRLKLLKLSAPSRKIVRDGAITTAHAVLLARLSAEDQARAIAAETGLFEREAPLFYDGSTPGPEPRKARTVREFEGWIDKNVRLEPQAIEPMLFPETAVRLEASPKVVPITREHYVTPEARTEKRTFGPQSWARADGEPEDGKASKTCPLSVTGFVVVGQGRGDAFQVCIEKDKCRVHWGSMISKREKRAREKAKAPAGEKATAAPAPAERKHDPKREAAIRESTAAAWGEIERRAIEASEKIDDLTLMRMLAASKPWEMRDYLAFASVKVGRDEGKAIMGLSREHIRAAFAFMIVTDDHNGDGAKLLKIDAQAIFKAHEKAALAALEPKPEVAKKAAPKKATKVRRKSILKDGTKARGKGGR